MVRKQIDSKRKEDAMAETLESQVPKPVADFNERIVRMLKELNPKDFLLVLSNPSRLVRVAADQQQQQQQQQQGHRSL